MRYYFLGLATLIAVCVGCHSPGQVNQANCEVPLDGGGGRGGPGGPRGPIVQANYQHPDRHNYVAPPANMLLRPGPMVDGPGPGVLNPIGQGSPRSFATISTQLRFVGPEGMQIGWQIPGGYAENQLIAPGRYNFRQGATYRLKLSNIPGRAGQVLYPTLQVYPSHPQTDAYLAHNSVPLQLREEDLDQVESNNFVTKVIYLPSPKHQELAIAGVEELVSTRLDPGIDPVAEADRRGTIMAVLRLGNMDLETPSQMTMGPEGVSQASHIQVVDGQKGQHMPPLPIAAGAIQGAGIPAPMVSGMPYGYGTPAYNPISGMGATPHWGMPITGTPIGLAGPPHLPYGGPAGLQSHTIRNKTAQHIPEPVDHFLLDVKHSPGIRMPEPARHVQYHEKHPVFREGDVRVPAGAGDFGGGQGFDPNCPPEMMPQQ